MQICISADRKEPLSDEPLQGYIGYENPMGNVRRKRMRNPVKKTEHKFIHGLFLHL